MTQARLLNLVGQFYLGLGDLREAERFLAEGYKIRRKMLSANDPEMAASLHNLAELRLVQGRNAAASELAMRAIEIRRDQLGKDHLETLQSRVLSLFCQFEDPPMGDRQKQFAAIKALIPKWQELLETRRRQVAATHIDIANLNLVLAGHFAYGKQTLQAMEHLAVAKAIYQRHGNANHLGNPLQLFIQAQIAAARGDHQTVVDALHRAIEEGADVFRGNAFHPVLLLTRTSSKWPPKRTRLKRSVLLRDGARTPAMSR